MVCTSAALIGFCDKEKGTSRLGGLPECCDIQEGGHVEIVEGREEPDLAQGHGKGIEVDANEDHRGGRRTVFIRG